MALETAEPSSTEAGFDCGSGLLFHEHEDCTEADFSTAALQSLVLHASRRKRKRKDTSEASPMETSRRRSCRFDGGAAAISPRHTGRPGSARCAFRQDQDEEGLARRHLRRRRPLSAIRTEYLGVSSAAFAPPLRRYLESPQHGRRALRSTTPPSVTRGIVQSPDLSSGRLSEESPTAATPEHVGWSITTESKERVRRGPSCGQGAAASCSTGRSAERRATLADSVETESLDGFAGPRVQQQPGRCPSLGLLTPVGPDWWETVPETHAVTKQSTSLTDSTDDDSVDQQSPKDKRHSNDNAAHSGAESESNGPSRREPRRNSGCSGDDRDGSPVRRAVRGSRRRRRVVRSSAWDLLTGRRMERGRRKGSRDIYVSDVSSIGCRNVFITHLHRFCASFYLLMSEVPHP